MAFEKIELSLSTIAASLAAIATALSTGAQATAVLGTPEVAAPVTKTRAKKSETTEAAAPAPVAATPATEPAPTPAPATPAASTASSQKPWSEVLAKVVEVNKSAVPTAGRAGVLSILTKFFGDAAGDKKVPALEALGKNDEVFAFAESLLVAAPAEDDLGL